MFKGKQAKIAAAFAISAAFSLLAGCASTNSAGLPLGTPDEGHSYDRRVLIRANTKVINVEAGEVIRFVVQDPDGAERSFTWHFNIFRETAEDLSAIAPTGFVDRPVRVVVGRNPLY